jgi:branched-chain amino acid transport system permease protein
VTGSARPSRSHRVPSRGTIALATVPAALVIVPLFCPPYVLHVAIVVLINVVYAEALYVIMRMGYLSFGHAGYIAIGAYTSALLATRLDVSVWIGFVAGGIVAAVFAWALGTVTLKLRGIYFSLSVFAFAEVVNAVFRAFDPPFGGPAGIAGVPRPMLFGARLNSHREFYYVVLVATVLSLAFLYRLERTRLGFTLLALRTRDTEALAESVGIDAARAKTLAFVTSCFFCGLMGAVHAHYLRFVSPFVFTFFTSTDLVIFNMVGGLGSFWGPVTGAAVLTALGEQLFAAGYWKSLVYAAVLLVVILAFPGGLVELGRGRGRTARRSSTARPGAVSATDAGSAAAAVTAGGSAATPPRRER